MPRSVPLSVRISDDDAAFLARYQAEGATTPSEKLRALLADARRMEAGESDFAGRVEWCSSHLQPALNRTRNLQHAEKQRSDFVGRLYERLPELLATLMTGPGNGDDAAMTLREFEADLAEQCFALMEEILDLGLTTQSRTYDPALIKTRLAPILEILDLVRLAQKPQGGKAK